MNTVHLMILAVMVILAAALVLYDVLHDYAIEWQEAHELQWKVQPWWVRLDHWIYNKGTTQVADAVVEHYKFFGGRLRFVGAVVTFAKTNKGMSK